MAEKSNKELLAELGLEASPKPKAARTAKEERVIAGFEEIQRFVEQTGGIPQHGESKDIFERLYAIRLDRIASDETWRALVSDMDYQGLLSSQDKISEPPGEYRSNADLLADLGLEVGVQSTNDITQLRHVRPRAEVRAAEEIGARIPCQNFDEFEPLFKRVKAELDLGQRTTKRFGQDASVEQGNFFIVGGLVAYVASVGKTIQAPNGGKDARLRVIFSNGTESDLLMRSLQRALYKDEAGRRITSMDFGPVFDDKAGLDESTTGTIYVLRSLSTHPVITEKREIIHKIGVTGGSIERRVANAERDPTYLMAAVEVVATYELYHIDRSKLERLLHRFFSTAKLEITISDRFGNPVVPQEWFLVPLFVIDDVVEKIIDGTIDCWQYDLESATLIKTPHVTNQ